MAVLVPQLTSVSRRSSVPDYQSNAFVSGFNMTVLSTTTLAVGPGAARSFGNDGVISYPNDLSFANPYLVADITLVGAGGCFPSAISDMTLTNNTVFGVYVIENSGGTTGGSLNPTVSPALVIATGDNFLPQGFDSFRRVGLVYISSSTNLILPWIQTGNGSEKTYLFQDIVNALSAGNSTVASSIDLTVGNGVIAPGLSANLFLGINFTADAAGDYASIWPTNYLFNVAAPVSIVNPAANTLGLTASMVSGNTGTYPFAGNASIDYLVASADDSLTINVIGLVDSLGNNLF